MRLAAILLLLAGCAPQVLVIAVDEQRVCQRWTTLPIHNTVLRCTDRSEWIIPAAILPPSGEKR